MFEKPDTFEKRPRQEGDPAPVPPHDPLEPLTLMALITVAVAVVVVVILLTPTFFKS